METRKLPIRILLIEDNESDGALLIRHLEKSILEIDHIRVETARELKQALDNQVWDIIISDFSLPQFDAYAALDILKDTGLDIPFIVVSGTIGEDTAVNMMRSGAQDYLMKGNLTRLIPAITRELADARVRLEHKLSEVAFRESEGKFRALFENSVDAIGISLNGIHVLVNPAYVSLFGYDQITDLIGKPVLDLIAPEEKSRIADYIRRRPSDPSTPHEYETRGIRKDGTILELDIRGSILKIDGSIQTLVIIRDITLRKMAETQLLAAKKKEEESSLMKSTLMMNMSHEVRTPMNAIIGFSTLISHESGESDIRYMAERIRISGDRLMKTLDDILELTQLQSGLETLELNEVNLELELAAIMQKFIPAAEQKNLKFRFHTDGKCYANINKPLFEKAVGELLNNAIKFTLAGGVDVELKHLLSEERRIAEIRILDSGIGIAKEHHASIFESFRQVSGGYARSYEGSGLGLTIAKKIVELFSGDIRLESVPGAGSTFIIQLDCIDDVVKYPNQPKISAVSGEVKAGKRNVKPKGKPVVLFVEDNDDNVYVTAQFCAEVCEIDSAATGKEALDKIYNRSYDLILMDIKLGLGINGLDVTRQIRANASYDHIPIVALTGLTAREDVNRLLSGGCDYYLGKPYNRPELVALIKKIFED